MLWKSYLLPEIKASLDEIAQFLENSGIILVQKSLELIEPRSDSLEEIAKEKAKCAQKTIKQPFIVDDSGLFIDCLNGFPGTNSNWVFKKIGYQGILALLEDKKTSGPLHSSARLRSQFRVKI